MTTGSATALNRFVFVTALLLAAGAGGFLAHRLVGSRAASLTAAPAPAQVPARTLVSQSPSEPEVAPPGRSVPERLPEMTEALQRMRPLATMAVVSVLAAEMERAVAAAAAEHLVSDTPSGAEAS